MKYTTYPGCTPSPAERVIIDRLRSQNVVFEREVSFDGLINPYTNSPLRYDFYIPAFNLIIEYDGREFHASDEVKQRDKIKDEFAKLHRIKLYRICSIPGIEIFFKSQYWTSNVARVILHKPRVKKQTKWQRNHMPKEEPKPFVPLNYSQEYIKKKIEENRAKNGQIPVKEKIPLTIEAKKRAQQINVQLPKPAAKAEAMKDHISHLFRQKKPWETGKTG